MYHFVSRLLILMTLLGNIAWATDNHVTLSQSDETALSVNDHSQQGTPCLPDCTSHHCCHASAHLLTIPGSNITHTLSNGQFLIVAADTSLNSIIPAPPYQPPRA